MTDGLPALTAMRAAQITRFGHPEVLEIVDGPQPTPLDGRQLYDVSTSGINDADAHHWESAD
jgi:NADPH:quinone reductase-like Zn-dependent oxidoreductase